MFHLQSWTRVTACGKMGAARHVAHACHPSSWGGRGRRIVINLGCITSFRTIWITVWDHVSWSKYQTERKESVCVCVLHDRVFLTWFLRSLETDVKLALNAWRCGFAYWQWQWLFQSLENNWSINKISLKEQIYGKANEGTTLLK